jgi:S-DNA-T family DNA segregation ATPase FtsK/SpoIIIE
MAKKKYRKFFGKGPLDYLPKLDLDPDTRKGIFVVFILAFGAISFLSLFGLAGALGEYLSQIIILVFGWGRWFFPLLLLAWGFLLYREEGVRGAVYLGGFIFLISLQTLFHIFISSNNWQTTIETGAGGGYIGYFLTNSFVKLTGFYAALIILIALFLVSLMLMFNTTLNRLFGRDSWVGKLLFPITWLIGKLFKRREESAEETEEEEAEIEEQEETEEEEAEEEDEEESSYAEASEDKESADEAEENVAPGFVSKALALGGVADAAKSNGQLNIWQANNVKINLSLDLLSGKIGKPTAGDVKTNVETIRRTLEFFGIPVEMGEVTVGPTVAQYTFKPAEGIMLSKITALNNNLSLALAAHPIRIEAPIPKKSLVGIEVPNLATATVGLRELLESDQFRARKSSLMVPLGKDVGGKIWFYDLIKMPHLMVAGQTNSGKSVCLNSIIVGLLYQNQPDDLRLILVDPKRVGMVMFEGLPHLLAPIITEAGKTINAMRWCINEMDRRFDLLSKYHQANIQEFNHFAGKQKKLTKLPYLVFVIDELADLKTVAAKDIEAGIVRLAQKGRAAGIHLIIATQRPDVTVITGLIKANLPARIAFAVTSGIDSKTILDGSGAEKLLGKGDMLFVNAEMSKPVRIQGAFVSTAEIKKVVAASKVQAAGGVQYLEELTKPQKVKGMAAVTFDGDGGDSDELLEEAKELIINSGRASTSSLQRRLGVGYGRAAKILDLLEEQGVIGPPNGSKPREVLVSREEYEAMINQGISGVSLHKREEAEAPDEFLETDDEQSEEESAEEAEDEEEEEEEEEPEEEAEENDEDTDADTEEEADAEPADEKEETEENSEPDLDEVYTEEESSYAKASEDASADAKKERPVEKKIAKPGDDDFDKLFSR